MSASTRKRANLQATAYPAAVAAFLMDDDAPVYDDGSTFRPVLCPDCGRLLLGCEHDAARFFRRTTRAGDSQGTNQ